MSKWMRIPLIFALAFVGAAVWGFVAVALGAPSIVVSLGALVIGVWVVIYGFKDKNSN